MFAAFMRFLYEHGNEKVFTNKKIQNTSVRDMIPCRGKISFHGHLHFWVPPKQWALTYVHVHVCSWLKVANGQIRVRTVHLPVGTLRTATRALWWISP